MSPSVPSKMGPSEWNAEHLKYASTRHRFKAPEFGLFPWTKPAHPALQGTLPLNTVDPWWQRHAWRYHPDWSVGNRYRLVTPGLGIATVAFAAFVAYDYWYNHSGPGKEETEYWENWMRDREARLAKEGHGHGHH
ncbi:hypothetical protein HK104_008912 [Borealophlyctis nickersoniae]|nr:hypothetical protein HK104_008912 [Borealophlyctis nickersoniae]